MALSKIPSAGFQDNVKFRNIIINGDMSIAQRGTSTASITGNGYHTLDRWQTQLATQGTWTQSQDTDVPSGYGFSKSLKMDCTTADASPAAGDYCLITTKLEGQNLQYLKKGTSSAESLTLSFWVKSSKTGTYIAELDDRDNTRAISKSYTIDTTDTWEKKTLTFAGDTSGVLDNDNARSLDLNFWLGAGTTFTSGTLATSWETRTNANRAVGQVNLADSTSNDWYITGVQLEAGEVASDFEFLPQDVNLLRCQRYYKNIQWRYAPTVRNDTSGGTGKAHNWITLYPEMRTTPTFTAISFTSTSGFAGDLVLVGADRRSLGTRATNACGLNDCLYANGNADLDAEL